MKTAKRMIVETKYVICPHCGAAEGGWLDDPRKVAPLEDPIPCDDCGQEYVVTDDTDVVVQ